MCPIIRRVKSRVLIKFIIMLQSSKTGGKKNFFLLRVKRYLQTNAVLFFLYVFLLQFYYQKKPVYYKYVHPPEKKITDNLIFYLWD